MATCGAGGLIITVVRSSLRCAGGDNLDRRALTGVNHAGTKICAESWGAKPNANNRPANLFMPQLYARNAPWQQYCMYTYQKLFTRGRLNPPLVSRPEKLMLAKRVIPCLDVHDGQVTRGVQFGKAEAVNCAMLVIRWSWRWNTIGRALMRWYSST